jgi:hypothetical protein
MATSMRISSDPGTNRIDLAIDHPDWHNEFGVLRLGELYRPVFLFAASSGTSRVANLVITVSAVQRTPIRVASTC